MSGESEIWQFYTRVEEDGRLMASCKACGLRLSAKPGRLTTHRANCAGMSEAADDHQPQSSTSLTVTSDGQQRQILRPRRRLVQTNITTYASCAALENQKNAETEQIYEAIAKFFYSCDISIDTVDSPPFRDLLEALRPGFIPPSQETVQKIIDKIIAGEIYCEKANLNDISDDDDYDLLDDLY